MGLKVDKEPLSAAPKEALQGAAGSSSNTMWPGPRLTSIPSGILIHPTVWPQYTNVTRQTNNGAIA